MPQNKKEPATNEDIATMQKNVKKIIKKLSTMETVMKAHRPEVVQQASIASAQPTVDTEVKYICDGEISTGKILCVENVVMVKLEDTRTKKYYIPMRYVQKIELIEDEEEQ